MLTPRTNILKGLLRHIYIEKGQIKCFNFSFLGWGLKVTYNSDFFEKLRPPPSVFKCPNLNLRHFCFFSDPPPYLGHCPKFSCFLIMTPPLSLLKCLPRGSAAIRMLWTFLAPFGFFPLLATFFYWSSKTKPPTWIRTRFGLAWATLTSCWATNQTIPVFCFLLKASLLPHCN